MTTSLLQPVAAMMLLTFAVWLYMYTVRLGYITTHGIAADGFKSPEQLNALLPETINRPSNNLKNLFELPVLFYALCLLLETTQKVDPLFVKLAWAYVALRAAHSLIHCTVNIVPLRFSVYVLSSAVLWAMVGRFALLVF